MRRALSKRTLRVVCLVSAGVAGAACQAAPEPVQATPQLTQVAYLKASNTQAGDHFGCGGEGDGHGGRGVAISGDGTTLAIAAPHEASGARGANGNQDDEAVLGSGAVYVFTRSGSGWAQQAYIKASNPGESDDFGHYVALSADGSTLAVSAHFESSGATGINGNQDDNSVPQSGAVYVFTRKGSEWAQQAYIKASNTGEAGTGNMFGDGDQFGYSMSLSDDGSTLAVGAINEDGGSAGFNGNQQDNSLQNAGAVYVFVRTGEAWTQQAYVKAPSPSADDLFGYSVSLSADGHTLAVGNFDEDGSARQVNGPQDDGRPGSGAVHVFTRAGTTWSQQAYLKTANAEGADSFGVHVALSDDGNTLAAGSLDEDCRATGVNPAGCDNDREDDLSTGAAYVFVRNGTAWTQQVFLKSSNTGQADWFGSRITLSGDGNTLAVSATLEDGSAKGIGSGQNDDNALDAGAVYFYTRRGETWTQHYYLKASNNEAFDEFGSSVALTRDGSTMVVTSRGEDSVARGINGNQADNTAGDAGAAYVFAVSGGR